MPWRNTSGAGFTDAGARPWLPIGDAAGRNVEDQRRDPASTLCFTRDLIALRRETGDLQQGPYRQLPSPPDAWVWQRGRGTIVAVNLSDRQVRIPEVAGGIKLATARSRDGERLTGTLTLGPWEGAVCSSESI